MVNLSSRLICEEINGAQRGSIVNSCVENIAYRLSLIHSQNDSKSNWTLAENYLECWAYNYTRRNNLNFETVSDLVESCLQTGRRAEPRFTNPLYSFAGIIIEVIENPNSYLFSRPAA